MPSFQEIIDAELRIREQLNNQILSLIQDRCDIGYGRLQRGALHLYIYNKLGFHGTPGNDFAKFITKTLVNAGYRDSYLIGKRCYCGLSWKGETKENWNHPQAKDIPHWIEDSKRFEFI